MIDTIATKEEALAYLKERAEGLNKAEKLAFGFAGMMISTALQKVPIFGTEEEQIKGLVLALRVTADLVESKGLVCETNLPIQ